MSVVNQPALDLDVAETMVRTAVFSDDSVYRYRLTRIWDNAGPNIHFVMLNPSRAGETVDDPTARKIVKFARRWGYGRCTVSNLFALVSPYPEALRRHADPIGPDNGAYLAGISLSREPVVAAWGAGVPAEYRDHSDDVAKLLRSNGALVLGLTKDGHPRHPLYLRDDTDPTSWRTLVEKGATR